MVFTDDLFPEPTRLLEQIAGRHLPVWVAGRQAFEITVLAIELRRNNESTYIPGVPSTRCVRTEFNDLWWRYFRSIGNSLLDDGSVREFTECNGGEEAILPDGLHVRLKKSNDSGKTSNIQTRRVEKMQRLSESIIFRGAEPLDCAIANGLRVDLVYIPGVVLDLERPVGIQLAATQYSPFVPVNPISEDELRRISPGVAEAASEARVRLAQ